MDIPGVNTRTLIIVGGFWLLVLTIMVAQLYKRNRLTNEFLGNE